METRKQQLLRRHRRGKRIFMVLALLVLVALDWFAGWNSLPVLLILAWIAHEAWLADHLFYSPREDYRYAFPDSAQKIGGRLNKGRLVLEPGELSDDADTLMLEVQVRTTWLGRWLDPHVLIADGQPCDRQDFERGAWGAPLPQPFRPAAGSEGGARTIADALLSPGPRSLPACF